MKRWSRLRGATWRVAVGSHVADLHRVSLRVADLHVGVEENSRLNQLLEAQVSAIEASLVPLLAARDSWHSSQGPSS